MLKNLFYLLPIKIQCFIQSRLLGGGISIGRKSYIHNSVHVLGKKNIVVGSNSCVSEGSWLNVNHRNAAKISIRIGNNCFIGKQNFFSSGNIISIGDYTLTAINCKIIGSTHKVDNPELPYLMTGTTGTDCIFIGVNCFIGAGATILGSLRIGHGAVIAANSLVLHDVPPFSIVVGNPATIIKRYSFSKKAWVSVEELTSYDESLMPGEDEYLLRLRSKFPYVNMPWIAAARNLGNI